MITVGVNCFSISQMRAHLNNKEESLRHFLLSDLFISFVALAKQRFHVGCEGANHIMAVSKESQQLTCQLLSPGRN